MGPGARPGSEGPIALRLGGSRRLHQDPSGAQRGLLEPLGDTGAPSSQPGRAWHEPSSSRPAAHTGVESLKAFDLLDPLMWAVMCKLRQPDLS